MIDNAKFEQFGLNASYSTFCTTALAEATDLLATKRPRASIACDECRAHKTKVTQQFCVLQYPSLVYSVMTSIRNVVLASLCQYGEIENHQVMGNNYNANNKTNCTDK